MYRMSSTYVTLAEVLEARGGPLEEDEVWALLHNSAESLLDLFSIGKAYSNHKCGHCLGMFCVEYLFIFLREYKHLQHHKSDITALVCKWCVSI